MIPLYQGILASDWERLHPTLRAAHRGAGHRARGRSTVSLAKHPLAPLVRWICCLPAPKRDCEVTLEISGSGSSERWLRHFDDRPLSTLQRQSGNLLAESFCAFEIAFRLMPESNQLTFEQFGLRFRLGSVHIPLPRVLTPRIWACETALDNGSIRVQVIIHAPLIGELMRYEGTITPEPAS